MTSTNLTSIHAHEGVQFGMNIPEHVNHFLQLAAQKPSDKVWAESHLKRALEEGPDQIEVYVALYKHYCYSGCFDEAAVMVDTALMKAVEQAGVERDWRLLDADATDWSLVDGLARLLLYSLKALAFISLRQGALAMANEALDKLLQLDPEDRVGASVVRDLAEVMNDE